MTNPGWILIFGLVFALIGVVNLVTGRLHPDRPNARMSRGLGYIGIVVGVLSFVFGLLQVTGILVPPPLPPPPAPAGAPASAAAGAPEATSVPAAAPAP